MTPKPKFMILPGTGMAGYRDYKFHFRKFLNGIVLPSSCAVVTVCAGRGVGDDKFI
jgi:hypothetical protein